jgi:nucleotide-binding universal stress UspA family protein
MKTILVSIDHTPAAEHTLAYANKLAVRWPAEVVLLYCHHSDAAAGETAAVLLTQEKRLRGLVERLRYQQLTRQNGRRIQYRYRVLAGCLHDHVQAEAAACAADLLVMGLEHIDCGQQVAPGNHAATITAMVSCPVLVVPAGRRALPNRLAFAADFDALNLHLLPRLSALASAFPGQLDLVQFYPHTARVRRRELKLALSRAAGQLTWPAITEHLVEDDAPLEGISEYCARTQAQLLIIAPASTAQLFRYFDPCYSQTQAYHTQIPVLVLRTTEQPASEACCGHCQERLEREATTSRLAAYRAVPWT